MKWKKSKDSACEHYCLHIGLKEAQVLSDIIHGFFLWIFFAHTIYVFSLTYEIFVLTIGKDRKNIIIILSLPKDIQAFWDLYQVVEPLAAYPRSSFWVRGHHSTTLWLYRPSFFS